jgi:hypothetical protein
MFRSVLSCISFKGLALKTYGYWKLYITRRSAILYIAFAVRDSKLPFFITDGLYA